MVDDIGKGIGGQGLGGTVGKRDRWGQAARNSSVVGTLSSRVNEESSLQTRVPADCCWGTVVSSSSSSEGKKSDDG